MTDLGRKLKNAAQLPEAEIKISEDHAEGKPSSESFRIVSALQFRSKREQTRSDHMYRY